MTARDPNIGIIHGYVMVIGPENNPNYFTGCGYSAMIDDAKVYRTARGANYAATIWQTADYGQSVPLGFWSTRRTRPVTLQIARTLL